MFSRRDDNAIKGYYGLSCAEGTYYICDGDETEFIGCCTSNPCGENKGVCPTENLRSATFSGDNYENLASQNCSNDQGTMNWWTCKFTKPPFMGCCSVNACGTGECPQANLVPAKLSSIESNRLTFLDPERNGDVTPSPSASTTSPTASASATSTSAPESSGLGTGALVGISVGATLGALVVLGLLFWRCFWLPRKRAQGQPMTQVAPNEYQPQTPANATFSQHGQSPQSQYNRKYNLKPWRCEDELLTRLPRIIHLQPKHSLLPQRRQQHPPRHAKVRMVARAAIRPTRLLRLDRRLRHDAPDGPDPPGLHIQPAARPPGTAATPAACVAARDGRVDDDAPGTGRRGPPDLQLSVTAGSPAAGGTGAAAESDIWT